MYKMFKSHVFDKENKTQIVKLKPKHNPLLLLMDASFIIIIYGPYLVRWDFKITKEEITRGRRAFSPPLELTN